MMERGGFTLSLEQADIVDNITGTEKVTVVSAGAGSGKTRTMVAAVVHLVDKNRGSINVDDFALITFTNKATDEMRERLENGVEKQISQAEADGDEPGIQFWLEQKERLASAFIGTIHRFCGMILKNFGYDEHIPHETEIIMAKRHFTEAMGKTLNEGMRDSDTSILFKSEEFSWVPYEIADYLKKLYDFIRGKGRNIDTVVDETLTKQPADQGSKYRFAMAVLLRKLHYNYNEVKKQKSGLDTNDLLLKSAELMKEYQAHVGKLLSTRFKYLFVDEFQDTDILQKEIIQSLIEYFNHVLMVGDRKQAIYRFRGSDDSILKNMADDNKVELKFIKASRRPTFQLHEVQTELFKVMSQKYEVLKELLTLPPEGAYTPSDGIIPFSYYHVDGFKNTDVLIETALQITRTYMTKEIDHHADGKRAVMYKDICFLFRTNYGLENYLTAFREAGIPVRTDIGGGFFRKPEILHCFYFIQAVLKYPDDVALYLVLGTPFLPVLPDIRLHKTTYASHQLCDWLEEEEEVERWFKGMMEIRNSIKKDMVPHLLTRIYEITGVREHYAKQGNIQAVANLEKLVSWSREQMNAEALTMQQFFDRLQVAILTNENYDEADPGVDEFEENAVVFSTVHSAKGLEFPIVIIPEVQRPILNEQQEQSYFDIPDWGLDLSLADGKGRSERFPEWLAQFQEFLFEEEARVLYVAVTRAQHAVCFIGGGKPNIAKDLKWRSWKDDILIAKAALEALGKERVAFHGFN